MRRCIDLRNQYTQLIGGLVAPDVPEDTMIKVGEVLNAKIAEAREEFSTRGKDDIRVFSDLVNLDFLGDPDMYPSELNSIVGTLAGLEPTCKALKALGVKYDPADIGSLQITAKKVARSPIVALVKLWNNYISYVSGGGDVSWDHSVVDDIIFESTKDLSTSVLTPALFAKEQKIEEVAGLNDNEIQDYIIKNRSEEYNEWVDLRCNDIIGALLSNPTTSAIIYPIGYTEACDEIKRILNKLEFIQDKNEIDELLTKTSANSLYGGSFYEQVLHMIKSNITEAVQSNQSQMALVQEAIQLVARTIDEYIDKNKISNEVKIGGQEFRPLQALTFTDILIHSMIRASYEIRTIEGKLSPETEYIAGLVREYLETELNVELSEFVEYRIISVISLYLNIDISRSIFLKVSDSTFAYANQLLGELCLQTINQ